MVMDRRKDEGGANRDSQVPRFGASHGAHAGSCLSGSAGAQPRTAVHVMHGAGSGVLVTVVVCDEPTGN